MKRVVIFSVIATMILAIMSGFSYGAYSYYLYEDFNSSYDRSQWVIYNASGTQGLYFDTHNGEDGIHCDPAIGNSRATLWFNDTDADFRWGNDYTITYELCCPRAGTSLCDYASRGFYFKPYIRTNEDVFANDTDRMTMYSAARNDWAISYENYNGIFYGKVNETAPSGFGVTIPQCGSGNLNATMTVKSQPDGNFYTTVVNNNNPSNFKTGYTLLNWNLSNRGYQHLTIGCYLGGGNNHEKLINSIEISITESSFMDSPPTVVISSPANNTMSNNISNLDIEFTATDDRNTTLECDLFVNEVFNQTNTSVINNTLTTFNIDVGVGETSFYIICADPQVQFGNSSLYRYWYDPNDPFIISTSPLPFNTTTFANDTINIYGNITNEELDYVLIEVYDNNDNLFYQNITTSFADPTNFYYNWVFATNDSSNGDWYMEFYANDTSTNENELNVSFTVANCIPDWVCSGYGACNTSDVAPCNAVTDNNACGEGYTGDYSEFSPQACNYCSPDLAIQSQTVCDSVTDTLNITYIDNNFATCCNVTSLGSDCPFGVGNETGINVTACSIFNYESDDIAEASIDFVTTFLIIIGTFALPIILLFGLDLIFGGKFFREFFGRGK